MSGTFWPVRWLALAVLCLSLSGCLTPTDGEQDLLCRRLLPALVDTRGVTVLASETGNAGEVFIRFRLPRDERQHFIYCRFAGAGFNLAKRRITRVALDGVMLGEAATFFLTEGWLQTQDAVAATPPPARADAIAGNVGVQLGYGLQQAVSALPRMGIYALVAAAYALIYGLTGRINLAFGAFAAIGGLSTILAVMAVDRFGAASLGSALLVGLTSAMSVSALAGSVTARTVLAPLMRRPGQHILVASVGLMVAIEEFLRLTQGARGLWLAPVFNAALPLAQTRGFVVTLTPATVLTAATAFAVALLLLIFMARSRFGREWRAASEDSVAAELFGVNPVDMVAATMAIAACLAGLAGALVALHYGGMGYAGGGMLGLTALVAAVLGGIGSVGGAMLGGCLIGLFEAAWSSVLPSDWREAALFALLVLFLTLKPDGLFSGRLPGPLRV